MKGLTTMKTIDYIYNGSKHIVGMNLTKAFDKYLAENKGEYVFLVPNSCLVDKWSLEKLFEKYYPHEIFEISNAYLGNFNEPYMLWKVKKSRPEYIKTSVFYKYAHPYRDNEANHDFLSIPDKFNNEYVEYLNKLDDWVNNDILPNDEKNVSEFNLIKYEEFDITKPYAQYYRKKNEEMRRLLSGSDVIKLGDVATISMATALDGGNNITKVKTLSSNQAPGYPYIPDMAAKEGFISSERLHKGDIIGYRNEYFLVSEESDFELYAPLGCYVIRANGVSPEYLYLYLNSNIAKRIQYTLEVPLGDVGKSRLYGSKENLPLIKPKETAEYYRGKFSAIAYPDKKVYLKLEDEKIPETVEEALTLELFNKIKLNNKNLLERQIKEDITELEICYANRAYKATLILAGSIMEAILIDWLSEIRGVDYFAVDLKKRIWDNQNKCYKTDVQGNYLYHADRKADLADYIDEIRDIKRPNWMQEWQEANIIRKKRNLVHAKLCLKENIQIDDTICKDVISYLKNIIDSRWK